MANLKIESVTIPVEQNIEFIDDGTEEFDIGTLIITNSTQREPYDDYSDIELTIGTETFEALVKKDVSHSKLVGVTYEHTITLVEPVIKLADKTHPDRKFDTIDGNKTTYKYHLQTILSSVDFGKTSEFTIHADTLSLLDVEADEKEYYGGNFLETVKEIMRTQNARPTLSLNNVIGHEMLNKQGTLRDFGTIISEVIQSDTDDYALKVHSKIKNATYEANLITGGTYYPAKGYGVTPRVSVDKEKYDDVDAIFILDSGIRRIIVTEGLNIEDDFGGTFSDFYIEIVSKEEWDDLTVNRDYTTVYMGKYKNNTPYYTEGDNIIQNIGTEYDYDGILIAQPKDVISMAIKRAVYLRYAAVTRYKNQTISGIELNFYYQPLRDIDTMQERHDISRVIRNSTKLNQQKDSKVELSRMGLSNKQVINRMGNDNYQFTKKYYNGGAEVPFAKGDYNSQGYRIVKRQFVNRSGGFDVIYFVSKAKSVMDVATNVNSSVSPFTIQKRSIETNFIYNEYIEFGFTKRTDTTGNKQLVRKVLLNALDYSATYDTPIYNCQYSGSEFTTDRINMSVQKAPMGNSFQFNAGFNSPKTAGYQLVSDTIGKKIVPVSYTDANGQVENARFLFGNECIVDPDLHPVGVYNSNYLLQVPLTDVLLNPNEALKITYALHLVSGYPDLIIGDYFLQNNSLVKELGVAQSLTLVYYPTNPYYDTYDKYIKAGHTGNGSYTVEANGEYIDINGVANNYSWALIETASPYRLYMAYNNSSGTNMDRVNVSMLENRYNIIPI